jgi:hypothetical protein
MPSLSRTTGYGHAIRRIADDHYRISWTSDRKYAGSRLRHPVGYSRDTDETGALRFSRKWGVAMPRPPEPKAAEPAAPG